MPKAEDIAHWKNHYSSLSDEEVIAAKHQWIESSEMHIAAVQLLHERQKERENSKHAEILSEIKRPHWSVTPSFYLLVLSAFLAAAALLVALS
ncbi:MAG: hypothetical protein Q8L39_09900 [Burkholderiales bacterium]|nr:hypothetical protein [Burkholderiales bacterium]